MRDRSHVLLAMAGGLLAVVIAVVTIHPFDTAPLSFDTASSVAYFDRIASGRHLEAFVTTTPKPLLTVTYGLLHALVPDWRTISWLLIAVLGLAVAAATALSARIGGAIAGVFTAVVLAGAPELLWDTSLGGGVPWAVLLVSGAGLAMTGVRRRPALAGVLLGLAALARFEAFVIVGIVLAAVAFLELLGRLGGARRPDPSDRWLAIALLALPVMLLHDWLLTGDPLYFTVPSATFSAAAPGSVMSPIRVVSFLAARYRDVWPLAGLAVVGGLGAMIRRRWVVAVGLVAAGPGIAAFLVFLAWRGTYVSDRYAELIDVALRFAAAIGFAILVEAALGVARRPQAGRTSPPGRLDLPTLLSSPPRLPTGLIAGAAAVAVIVAVVGSRGWGPWDTTLRAEIAGETSMNRNLDRVLPQLRTATATLVSGEERSRPGDYRSSPSQPPPRLVVPVLLRPRAALDLDLPLWAVSSASPLGTDPSSGSVASTIVIYHDSGADRPSARYSPYESLTRRRLGLVDLSPLWSDPSAGLWIVRLDPVAQAASPP